MTATRAGLTEAQLRAFNFIARHIETHGISPSVSEIAEALRLASKSGVCRLVDGLVERGYVTRLPNRARTLAIVPDAAAPARVDCLRPDTQARLLAYCRGTREPIEDVIEDAVALFLDQRVVDVIRDGDAVADGRPTLHEAFKGTERRR